MVICYILIKDKNGDTPDQCNGINFILSFMTDVIVPNGKWHMLLMSKYSHAFFIAFLVSAHSTINGYQQLLSLQS